MYDDMVIQTRLCVGYLLSVCECLCRVKDLTTGLMDLHKLYNLKLLCSIQISMEELSPTHNIGHVIDLLRTMLRISDRGHTYTCAYALIFNLKTHLHIKLCLVQRQKKSIGKDNDIVKVFTATIAMVYKNQMIRV